MGVKAVTVWMVFWLVTSSQRCPACTHETHATLLAEAACGVRGERWEHAAAAAGGAWRLGGAVRDTGDIARARCLRRKQNTARRAVRSGHRRHRTCEMLAAQAEHVARVARVRTQATPHARDACGASRTPRAGCTAPVPVRMAMHRCPSHRRCLPIVYPPDPHLPVSTYRTYACAVGRSHHAAGDAASSRQHRVSQRRNLRLAYGTEDASVGVLWVSSSLSSLNDVMFKAC